MTKEEAIEYCFTQIKPSLLDEKDYNKFRLIRNRYRKGELREKAIQTLFARFEIKQHCYYTNV